jgi:U32 family peptidase
MKPELLAPIGDWETLSSAIKAGADSVYFGIKWINMRSSSARNFDIEELPELMQKLHKNKVKGYLALNTLIYDHELEKAERIINAAIKSKVDAIIASDMAIVNLCNKKKIEVHMSTQLSISNYQAVKFYSKYSPRMILARECTLEQIKSIKSKIKKEKLKYKNKPIELEAFIHGSLCVAYSGRCFMSQYHNRLSANRGQCLQECRKKYKIIDIEDSRREFLLGENYILSPKDLCTIPILDKLIKSGISILKIEGRAKGPEYIYNVTKAYRTAIDLIQKNKFTKKQALKITKELEKVYNRGFSTNFLLGTPTNNSWTDFYGSTAKEQKTRLGKVTNFYPKINVVAFKIEQNETLKENSEVCFIGPTTGYYKTKAKSLRINNKLTKKAKQGDEVSFKVKEKLREADTAYLIKPRNINKEEESINKQFAKIGIHKPFKYTKKDRGMV